MTEHTKNPAPDPAAARFAQLPERVEPRDYVESVDVADVPDPKMGRDPNTEWMLKHA